ncbi:uncharacterized protein LOC122328063 [Puntigrus tetrazona]|uniref:uncharacterized protein LOC122328063 n=1 Tax=Puntigrus tetrazona TaxID=1606681 RepID=UPI001C89643C|nr:uncharacterized protein LOC122328063 [Puntigrus tetrazona]
MKIVPLQIYLLMVSSVTESVRNTAVSLGSELIISCDLDIKEIYWIRHKSPDPPEIILRSYDHLYDAAKYENITFKPKYSVKTNSRLWIRNISTDESGVYYCVKTSEPLKFSNGTRIYINDTVHESPTESCSASQQEIPWIWRNLTITSLLFNVLLIVALIGKSYLQSRRLNKTSADPQSTTAAQYSNNSHYSAADVSTRLSENRPHQEQSIYSLLQPVKV